MSPLRWDVLLAGFVLSLPVLALGMRGDLSVEEMSTRVLWCLAAGWAAVAVLRLALTPRRTSGPGSKSRPTPVPSQPPAEDAATAPAP